MNKYLLDISTTASLICIVFMFFTSSLSGSSKDDKEIIIGLEKAALDRWGKGDTKGYIELAADEITYFDPSLESRLDKLTTFNEYLTPLNGTFSIFRYEMLNPTVQLHGNVGVLTFNLNNYSSEGKITSQWNCTEVYTKIKGEWKIIHSHWSYVKPELK